MRRFGLILVTLLFLVVMAAAQEVTTTPTELPTPEPSATVMATATDLPLPTDVPTLTPAATLTASPTETETETPSVTPTLEISPTSEGTPTETSTPDGTSTLTSTPEDIPTETATLTPTLTPTAEPLPLAYLADFENGLPAELAVTGVWLPAARETGSAIQADNMGGSVRYTGGLFGDVEVSAQVYALAGTFSLTARETETSSGYTAILNATDQTVQLYKDSELIHTGSFVLPADTWITFSLRVVGNDLIASVDGLPVALASDSLPLNVGQVGFAVSEGSAVRVDDFAIYGVVAGEVLLPTPEATEVELLAAPQSLIGAMSAPAGCPFNGISMVSVSSSGTPSNIQSWLGDISGDGRYVVFASEASNLVENDIDNENDIFRHDRLTCTTILVSGASNVNPFAGSNGSISADGSKIVFSAVSTAPSTQGEQLFLYDANTGTTTLVSSANNGTYGSDTISGQISGNGQFLLIEAARSLSEMRTDPQWDVYLRNLATGQNTLITTEPDPNSLGRAITDDGRYVVFSTYQSYSAADTDNTHDDYRYDRLTGDRVLVSPCKVTFCPDDWTYAFDISGDGNQILLIQLPNTDHPINDLVIYTVSTDSYEILPLEQTFKGYQAAYFSEDANTIVYDAYNSDSDTWQVYAYSRSLNLIQLLSQAPDGREGDGMSGLVQVISADGKWAAFNSAATNLVPGTVFPPPPTNSLSYIYLAPIVFPPVTPPTPPVCPVSGINMVSVSSNGIQANRSSSPDSISGDGRYVMFSSYASNLVTGDNDNASDVFRHDRLTCTTILVSDSPFINGQQNAEYGSISNDGNRIIFRATRAGMNSDQQLFLYDVTNGSTTLVSSANNGSYGSGTIRSVLSRNGLYLLIDTESQLAAEDTNAWNDAYLRDLTTGQNILITTKPDFYNYSAAISSDGRYVLFRTDQSYSAADTDNTPDDYRYDRLTGNRVLVTPCKPNVCPDDNTFATDISADGNQILIQEVPSAERYDNKVMVYTVSTGNYEILPLQQRPKALMYAFFSDDRDTVIYNVQDLNSDVWQVYAYRRSLNLTQLLSQSSEGIRGDKWSWYYFISADGNWAAFNSEATNLVSGIVVSPLPYNAISYVYLAPITFPTVFTVPTTFSASGTLPTSILLRWVNATGYSTTKIERRATASDPFVEVASLPATATSYTHSGLACNQGYQYRARAYNAATSAYSGYSDIVTGRTAYCVVSSGPGLVAPANNAFTRSPVLDWNAAVNASTDELQLSTVSTFATQVSGYPLTGLTATEFTPTALPDGSYYWRVRAFNDAPTPIAGPFSEVFRFTVDTVALTTAPTPLRPANFETVTTTRPTFSWSPVAGAARYKVQIAASGDFSQPIATFLSTVASFTLPVTAPVSGQGTYFWRVLAIDAVGNDDTAAPPAPWSEPVTFTVDLRLVPTNGARMAPTGTSNVGSVRFQWAAATMPPGSTAIYTVEIELNDTDNIFGTLDATLTCAGVTATTCTIPTIPTGRHLWRLSISGSANTTVRAFYVSPPAPLAPVLTRPAVNASVGANPTLPPLTVTPEYTGLVFFQWNPVANAASYEFELSSNPAFNTISEVETRPMVSGEGLNFDVLVGGYPAPDGVYYWRVRSVNDVGLAGAFSAPRRLVVDRIPPTAPVLIPFTAPIASAYPAFRWNPVSGAVAYVLSVRPANSFINVTGYDYRLVTGTSFTGSVALGTTPLNGEIVWAVTAVDAAGNLSDVTEAYATVDIGLLPARNQILYTTAAEIPTAAEIRPTFSWTPVAGATGYRLIVSPNPDMSNAILTFNPPANYTRYTLPFKKPDLPSEDQPALRPGNRYYWKIEIEGANNSALNPRSFFVSSKQLVVLLAGAPVSGAFLNTPTPTFTWADTNTVLGGTSRSYELQVSTSGAFTPATTITETIAASAPYTLANILPNTTGTRYYWRVRAVYTLDANAFIATLYTPTRAFTLDTTPPPAPVLTTIASVAGFTVGTPLTRDDTPIVVVTTTNPADLQGLTRQHEIQFSTSSAFPPATTITQTVSIDLSLDDADWSGTLPAANSQVFYVRARAVYTDGTKTLTGPYSALRTFKLDNVAPLVPVIAQPAQNTDPFAPTLLHVTHPTIKWQATSDAVRFEVLLDDVLVSPVDLAARVFTLPVTSPALTQGYHSVVVRAFDAAGNNSISLTRDFLVSMALSPAAFSFLTDPTPTFTFKTIPGYTGTYRVHIYDNSVNTTVLGTPDCIYTSPALSPTSPTAPTIVFTLPNAETLPFGTYAWMALEESPTVNTIELVPFAVVNTVNLGRPTLTAVAGDNFVNAAEWNNSLQIDWTEPPAVQGIMGVVSEDISITPSFVTTASSFHLPDGRYYIRGRMAYFPYLRGPYSPTYSFIVDTVPPATPTLTAPVPNAVIKTRTPTFTWSGVAGAVRYQVELADDEGFTVNVRTLPVTVAALALPNYRALTTGDTYWRVIALDAAGNSSLPSPSRRVRVTLP